MLEEFRDLSIIEWNFRELLRKKLNSLLRQQQIYWKQRGTVKWVKFGDEGTKFFHANATIKQRRNLTTSLQNDNHNDFFITIPRLISYGNLLKTYWDLLTLWKYSLIWRT
jgi:hypothetical protein